MTKSLFSGQIKKRGPLSKQNKIFFHKTPLIKDRKLKKLFDKNGLIESILCLGHNAFKSVY